MVVAGKLRDQASDVLSAKVKGKMVSIAKSSWREGEAGTTPPPLHLEGLVSSPNPAKFLAS
jgi:hypothetical protein